MKCLSLWTEAFRNLQERRMTPGEGVNLISGGNGQGKTSLIEAIHFSAYLKSFRTSDSRALIRKGESRAVVRVTFSHRTGDSTIAVVLEPKKRIAFIDGKRATGLRHVVGRLKVVSMTPEDLRLFDGPPRLRRSMVDQVAVMVDPLFSETLLAYNKALKNRNVLLKGGGDGAMLEAVETVMAPLARKVLTFRRLIIEETARVFEKEARKLLGPDLFVGMKYHPSIDAEEEELLRLWASDRLKDRTMGYTRRGPHADDIKVLFKSSPATSMASRGQKKAILFALRIAQAEVIEQYSKNVPILLFDDLVGDLDRRLTASIWNTLWNWKGQSFVTSVDEPPPGFSGRVFRLASGRIMEA